MTSAPMPHDEACTVLSKLTRHGGRTESLQEVTGDALAQELLATCEKLATVRVNFARIAEERASFCQQRNMLRTQRAALIAGLIASIEGAGFSVSGPTDYSAAEHGEPVWVCNARATIAAN